MHLLIPNSKKHINRQKRYNGFNLTELIIYLFILMVVMATILSIFLFVSRGYSRSTSAFGVQQEVQTGVHWLKRDLQQTSLNSVVVYPNADHPNEPPGVSMISAVEYIAPGDPATKTRNMQISEYGVPQWQKYVFYTIIPNPYNSSDNFNPRTAKLVRWEKQIPASTVIDPKPSDILPSTLQGIQKTVISSVMAPGTPLIKGIDHLKDNAKVLDYGGFRVQFVRNELEGAVLTEKLYYINPADVFDNSGLSGDETQGKTTQPTSTLTPLVQVDFMILQPDNRTGKPSVFSTTFQAAPRN
ncbi:MAG: hypothetical protein LWY06_07730 [Firmicutes bacterium]|nr:hypothetical protein [Bacillota bacterium]